jgi:hypothetical protein
MKNHKNIFIAPLLIFLGFAYAFASDSKEGEASEPVVKQEIPLLIAYRAYDIIFTGKATKVSVSKGKINGVIDVYHCEFEILESFRGKQDSHIIISSVGGGKYEFVEGESYIVFANMGNKLGAVTSKVSRTKKMDLASPEVKDEIEKLRNLSEKLKID